MSSFSLVLTISEMIAKKLPPLKIKIYSNPVSKFGDVS